MMKIITDCIWGHSDAFDLKPRAHCTIRNIVAIWQWSGAGPLTSDHHWMNSTRSNKNKIESLEQRS